MSIFGPHAPDAKCGLVIDVGSASIAAAIVISERDESKPTVVWTKTEHCPIAEEFTIENLAKRISSALLNLSLSIGSNGLKALADHDETARITHTHVTIAAPWSFTIPKRITTRKDTPFVVTSQLLTDLQTTAENELTEQYSSQPLFSNLGLEIIDSDTTHYTANGYTVTDPTDQSVTELSLVQQLTITQKQLLDGIRDVHEKITPNSKLLLQSYMHLLFRQAGCNMTNTQTYGLIDISGDAVEVGIVQQGVLSNVLHATWGYRSLVREIAATTQQPLDAALSTLHTLSDNPESTVLTPNQHATYNTAQDTYIQKVQETITRTAAMSEMPNHILLHTETGLRSWGKTVVKKALANTASNTATVALISEKLIDTISTDETRLAASIAHFHGACKT